MHSSATHLLLDFLQRAHFHVTKERLDDANSPLSTAAYIILHHHLSNSIWQQYQIQITASLTYKKQFNGFCPNRYRRILNDGMWALQDLSV